jgi:hypothetical protein
MSSEHVYILRSTFPQEEDSDLDDEVEYEIDTSLEKVPSAASSRLKEVNLQTIM